MTPQEEKLPLQETIKQLYGIIDRLDKTYKPYGRKFTLDGHLLGSIGEVWVAEHYGIRLYTNSAELYDGEYNGKKVQIKITQTNRVSFYGEPEFLLVFKLNPDGTISEIYNGPSKGLLDGRSSAKNGQTSISLNILKKLAESVPEDTKIPYND